MQRKLKNSQDVKKYADTLFSWFVRINHSTDGMTAECVTCGKKQPLTVIHAGHFISRTHTLARWDEINVHPQCETCNVRNCGEETKHRDYIAKNYGQQEVERLEGLKDKPDQDVTMSALEIINTYYKVVEEHTMEFYDRRVVPKWVYEEALKYFKE